VTHAASHPLGPSLRPDGVAFSVYAAKAMAVDLLLFDAPDAAAPARTIALDPVADRTGPYWHTFVPGIGAGQVYAWRADGPWAPERGLRFDGRLALLDPYAPGVAVPSGYRRAPVPAPDGSYAAALKSVVVDLDAYDWEGDAPLHRAMRDTVIYEAHLRGMTADPSSGVPAAERGTYRGLIHKLPYLVELGVTAIELLPVYAFDRLAAPAGLVNHWGYQPISWFAPHPGYATRPDAQVAMDELRDLVKACHRAGLEVILDVVYNHTAEGGPDEPTFSLRGLANDDYYTLDTDRSRYVDATGCGNTVDAGSAVARRMILDSLRFWVRELHVDGFRFDLAAVLARDSAGQPAAHPAAILDIDTDPVLAGTKLIAEPWDAGGLYLVGGFQGDRWVEWNGRFRDDVRSFVKSDPGKAAALGQRLLGSPDLYGERERTAPSTVNFVTCHDGMTLNDLVTYDRKRNAANGEGGRDGTDDDRSWGCGADGPTDDPAIEALRARQVRNLLALTALSVGVPMLLMGDEARRTQGGNNNAYCHDDPTTWLDWTLVEREAALVADTRALLGLRRRLQALLLVDHGLPLREALHAARVAWSGVELGEPDLGDASRSLALTVHGPGGAMHLIANAYWEPLSFAVPPDGDGAPWRVVLDTTRPGGRIVATGAQAPVAGPRVDVGARSVVVLVKDDAEGRG
jgi:glycogen operon protein